MSSVAGAAIYGHGGAIANSDGRPADPLRAPPLGRRATRRQVRGLETSARTYPRVRRSFSPSFDLRKFVR
jgi:hypothetical protein